jgi:hypothetical protein
VTDETEPIARRIREAVAEVHAPPRLHAVVAEHAARHRRARRGQLLALGGGAVGAVAAVVVVLVLVLGGGGGPAMDDAVALALRPPTTHAPAVDPADPGHIEAEVGGVRFPTYETFRPIGARTDQLDGRRAVTVAYRADGGPVTYTIVDGAPLAVPGDARWRTLSGFRVAVLRDDSQRIVTWEQGGRTCIVAGTEADVAALLREARTT